jgi:hypothetical protein
VTRKPRPPIPTRTQHEILFRNQNVCCVCQEAGVQIHHLDGNPSNNSLSNLCILCIRHHAEASSKSSMVKGLSPELLKKYKTEWEGRVIRKRQLAANRRLKQSSKVQTDLIQFEIKRTAYGLHESKSEGELNESIDYLYMWSTVDGRKKDIIDTLSDIHWMLNQRVIKALARRLHEFFWHFFDPERIPMSRQDERVMLTAVETLQYMGVQIAMFDYNVDLIQEIGRSLERFHQIASIYSRPRIMSAIIEALRSISKECESSIDDSPKAMKEAMEFIESKVISLTSKPANYAWEMPSWDW